MRSTVRRPDVREGQERQTVRQTDVRSVWIEPTKGVFISPSVHLFPAEAERAFANPPSLVP
jgi:hypothetical protein